MIDISEKDVVFREAETEGSIELSRKSLKKIEEGETKKGDVFQVKEISAIQAVKKTPENKPYCPRYP